MNQAHIQQTAPVGLVVVGAPPIVDVWSRTTPKYRVRAIILLAVNVLLFAGVCSFAFWLRSGERFAPLTSGYRDQLVQTLRFTGEGGVTLGSLLLEPINVLDVPMQISIIGLLMAALISMPILVAILYRFWSAIPFIASVAFLAVMPWLAITLLGSCVVASVKPFRTSFRFMSALMGLVPLVIYFLLAWRGSSEILAGQIDPTDRIRFIAPWVLAVVAAGTLFALVLTIARIVNYRTGAITPLLAVMFILPVLLFEFHVGRDELYYRVLESHHRSYFADVDASMSLEEAVDQEWKRHPLPRPSREAIRRNVEQKWLFALTTDLRPHETELARRQYDISARCNAFLHQFPDSRYAPNAIFVKAQAWDMRVDTAEFKRARWVRFYDDFPRSGTHLDWQILAERPYPLIGAVAELRLAQLEARDGKIDLAAARLTKVIGRLSAPTDPVPSAGARRGAFASEDPEFGLNISKERVLLDARRLQETLAANRDPRYGFDPLSGGSARNDPWPFGLLDFDPRHEQYANNLRLLLAKYPGAQIEDNVEVELAKLLPLPERVERLEGILARFPKGDAAPQALFLLGMAYREQQQSGKTVVAFARLEEQFPESIWAEQARRYAPRTAQALRVTTRP